MQHFTLPYVTQTIVQKKIPYARDGDVWGWS
jgi:hypothetical protein